MKEWFLYILEGFLAVMASAGGHPVDTPVLQMTIGFVATIAVPFILLGVVLLFLTIKCHFEGLAYRRKYNKAKNDETKNNK